jgi:HTTM domain
MKCPSPGGPRGAPLVRALRAFAAAWNEFFHAPQPVEGIALFRILWGTLLLLNWAFLAPDALDWFGERGVLSSATALILTGPGRLDVLRALPGGDGWMLIVFGAVGLASATLAVGFMTRTSAAVVFVGLVSLHHRNTVVLSSGDTILRVLTFLLMFAPAGDAWSVDRWRARRRGVAPPEPLPKAPWAQRLIQIQVAILYLSTAWWKLLGPAWRDGTAVYYMSRLVEFERFPVPVLFDDLRLIRFVTWTSLATELALGTLVWVPGLRYPVLLAGACLHLSIEVTMNIPVFQWLMLAALTTFIPPADVAAVARRVRARLTGSHRPEMSAAPPGPGDSEGEPLAVARSEGSPSLTRSEGDSRRRKSNRSRRRDRR